MQHQEILDVIAKVAVALAGFTGIFTASIFNKEAKEFSGMDKLRIKVMIDSSLMVVIFAIFPMVLNTWEALGEAMVWKISGVTFVFYIILNMIRRTSDWRKILNHASYSESPLVGYLMNIGYILGALLILSSIAFNILSLPALYITQLFWGIISGGLMFHRILFVKK